MKRSVLLVLILTVSLALTASAFAAAGPETPPGTDPTARAGAPRLPDSATLVTTNAGAAEAAQPRAAAPAAITAGQPDSKGTDFWLAFLLNFVDTPALTLFITGDTNTTGTVSIPGLAFSAPFAVTAGTVTSVVVPSNAEITTSDTVESKGIHVTAQDEVTVYGLNRIQYTTDAYLGLPTDILSNEYIVLGYKNVDIVNGTEFGVVATQDGTTVTIVPSVTTGAHVAGVPYAITLNQGQAYQLINTGSAPNDLSGTIVTSDKPIAVFGGHACANIPNGATYYCDHVVEELPPTSTWGKSFVTEPLATRLNGDTFRFLASTDGTTVSVNGAVVATLNRGQLYEQIITGAATVTADKPILVAQYSNGSTWDGITSDPFMMLIPPYEQFLGGYTVTTPASGFAINYINVVAPAAAVGAITLDGSAIPAGNFTPIGSSGFSGAQVSVALGSHTLAGPLPFGAFMYGFADDDSYGYPGGLSLAPIAVVTHVMLAPKEATNPVGTQHCVVATVTDQQDAPVVGVRVDFNVTGANPTAGFDETDQAGQAHFCYTGTNAGLDTITASVGTLSDTATKTWTPPGFRVYGYIFLDTNSNGVRELTELSGIQVPVTLKQGATTVGSVWSFLPGGWYDFGLYDPGNYCVQAAIPPEYVVTSANPVCFTLDQDRGINIGVRLGQATIGDFVWYDDNANGVQDAGELGIGNVTVALWSGAGGVPGSILQTATTAADGKYLFDVVPGTYFVQVTDANGVLTGLTLTVGPQSKPNPAGPISVVDGSAYLDADFGYALVCATGRGGLSGHVWLDANGDQVLGGTEAGIAGVTVCAQPLSYLTTRCAVTNGWGVYRMCLPKGTYLVAPDKGSTPLAGLTATTKEFLLPAVIKPGTHVEANFGYK